MPKSETYEAVAARLSSAPSREDAMQQVVDLLWGTFGHNLPMSWIGFYQLDPEAPVDRRLVLGPHRDKPACSPIGMHGVCGRAIRAGQTQIVRDVAELGDQYIACDPRDRSEIVVPLVDETGECRAVLDIDSWQVGAFNEDDAYGLRMLLEAAGLLPTPDAVKPPGA